MNALIKRNVVLYAMRLCACMFLFISFIGHAQPSNDHCNNATTISIPNAGFGMGTFTSSVNDISQATLQTGETFAPAI